MSGWWPSASAMSAACATKPNARRKSGNENSRRSERFPSRSQSGTSNDIAAASSSGNGGVPGSQASQCALASSATPESFAASARPRRPDAGSQPAGRLDVRGEANDAGGRGNVGPPQPPSGGRGGIAAQRGGEPLRDEPLRRFDVHRRIGDKRPHP